MRTALLIEAWDRFTALHTPPKVSHPLYFAFEARKTVPASLLLLPDDVRCELKIEAELATSVKRVCSPSSLALSHRAAHPVRRQGDSNRPFPRLSPVGRVLLVEDQIATSQRSANGPNSSWACARSLMGWTRVGSEGRTAPLDLRRPLRYGDHTHHLKGCWMAKNRCSRSLAL